MLDLIVIIFIGWPALIASLLAWVAGLVTKKFKLVVIAGIIILPFAIFYIGAYLNSGWLSGCGLAKQNVACVGAPRALRLICRYACSYRPEPIDSIMPLYI
jgi:hypothetical protein